MNLATDLQGVMNLPVSYIPTGSDEPASVVQTYRE